MDIRKRRAISSALGKIDLGEVPEKEMLRVDDPTVDDLEDYPELPEQLPQHRRQPAHGPIDNRTMSFGSKNQEEEEESFQQIEQRIRAAKNEKKIKNQTASAAAVSRLEILTGIGRLVTDVEIENVKFSLRSLKSKEIRDIMQRAVNAKSNIEEALVLRTYTLAYSIYNIDNNPIESYIGSYNMDEKVDLVDNLEDYVVGKLWQSYSDMLQNHNNMVKQDLGDNAKDILNNIKKS